MRRSQVPYGGLSTVTLFHLLAAPVAQDLAGQSEEELAIDFVVDGLGLRHPVGNKPDVDIMLAENSMAQAGADYRFPFTSIMPVRELTKAAVGLARERCEEMFWSFSLPANLVSQLQARIVRSNS